MEDRNVGMTLSSSKEYRCKKCLRKLGFKLKLRKGEYIWHLCKDNATDVLVEKI